MVSIQRSYTAFRASFGSFVRPTNMSTHAATPRLFYWEDALDCYVPVPVNADTTDLRSLIGFHDMEDSGEVVVRFKRLDLTDEALEALPEA